MKFNSYCLAGLFVVRAFISTAQQTVQNVTIGTVDRTYIQYLPTGFQEAENMPVVVVLHGIGADGANMIGTGFNQIADTARFIAVYPTGLPNGWGQTSWNNGTLLASAANDIGLFNYILDDLILNKNADPTRVYFTGFSMGGIMTHHMACQLNSRVAAIGSMSGTIATGNLTTCSPSFATPVIHLHGDIDGTIPYDGSALPSLALVPQTIEFWRSVHGCATSYDSIRMPDIAADDITVDRFVYNNCSQEGSLELWRMNNADHVFLYEPVNDITESKEIWRFFLRFQHPSPASAQLSQLEYVAAKLYPNPSNDFITIESLLEVKEFRIVDVMGRTLIVTDNNTIDIQALQSGRYFVEFNGNVISFVKE